MDGLPPPKPEQYDLHLLNLHVRTDTLLHELRQHRQRLRQEIVRSRRLRAELRTLRAAMEARRSESR